MPLTPHAPACERPVQRLLNRKEELPVKVYKKQQSENRLKTQSLAVAKEYQWIAIYLLDEITELTVFAISCCQETRGRLTTSYNAT